MSSQIPDITRKLRRPAITPYLQYVQIQNTAPVIVGALPTPLSFQHIPCTVILIQADNSNAAIVCIGGQSVTVASGMQLDAGRACLFSTDQSMNAAAVIASASGLGMANFTVYQQSIPGPEKQNSIEVISLRDVFGVSTIPNQILRVTYISYIT